MRIKRFTIFTMSVLNSLYCCILFQEIFSLMQKMFHLSDFIYKIFGCTSAIMCKCYWKSWKYLFLCATILISLPSVDGTENIPLLKELRTISLPTWSTFMFSYFFLYLDSWFISINKFQISYLISLIFIGIF